MRSVVPSLALATLLLLTAQQVTAEGTAKAAVLFDFNDGTYHWADITLGENRTAFNATLTVAGEFGLNVEYQWSSLGVWIEDIGDRDAVFPVWWHLFVWNKESTSWVFSDLGASDLVLSDGDAIAWHLGIDNPTTFESSRPSPTPMHRYPHLSFRGDVSNSGHHTGPVCDDFAVEWWNDTGAFEISGTPATANGVLYLPTWTGLIAYDIETGSRVWQRDDIGGMSSPALNSGRLYIGGRDGRLHQLWASNGTEIWSKRLIQNPDFTGIASSPTVYMDRVYVGLFNESGGYGSVVSLSVWDGSIVWNHTSPSIHMSSPAIHGETLFVGVMGYFDRNGNHFDPPHGLLALNVTNGHRRWFLATNGPVASSPLILGDTVVFTSKDGILHAISTTGQPVYWKAISNSTSSPATDGTNVFVADGLLLGGHGYVRSYSTSGEELWRTYLPGPIQSSILYADHRLFVTTNEGLGTLYVLDSEDGSIDWRFTPEPHDYILSSPVASAGRVFVASDNGIIYALGCMIQEGGGTDYLPLIIIPIAIAFAVVGVALLIPLVTGRKGR